MKENKNEVSRFPNEKPTYFIKGRNINILRCLSTKYPMAFFTPTDMSSYLDKSPRNCQRLLNREKFSPDTTLTDSAVKMHEIIDNGITLGHYRPLYVIDYVTFHNYLIGLEFKHDTFEQERIKNYRASNNRPQFIKELIREDYYGALYRAILLKLGYSNLKDIKQKAYDYYFQHSEFGMLPRIELIKRVKAFYKKIPAFTNKNNPNPKKVNQGTIFGNKLNSFKLKHEILGRLSNIKQGRLNWIINAFNEAKDHPKEKLHILKLIKQIDRRNHNKQYKATYISLLTYLNHHKN